MVHTPHHSTSSLTGFWGPWPHPLLFFSSDIRHSKAGSPRVTSWGGRWEIIQNSVPCQTVPELLALSSSILVSSHPTTTHFQPHHHPPGASHTSTHDLLFSTISFHLITFPLLMTTRSSKFITIRKKPIFLPWSATRKPFLDFNLTLLYTFFCLKFRVFSQTLNTQANPHILSLYLSVFPIDATNLWAHQPVQKTAWIIWDPLSVFKTVVPACNWKSALCYGSAESPYFKTKTQVFTGK